jgi:mRNA interferase RelE/StbE
LVKIYWTEDAVKDLGRLDKPIEQRVLKKISWLSNNFESITPEPLSGEFKGTFKLRIGDWRVVYTVEGQTLIIQFIAHRREIYKF